MKKEKQKGEEWTQIYAGMFLYPPSYLYND
jgi:hypothetical protein